MHQLQSAERPRLLQELDARVHGKVDVPSIVYGYLKADAGMQERHGAGNLKEGQQWFVDKWPDFHSIMLQDGQTFSKPSRSVWSKDSVSASAFFADPAFKVPEFFADGVDPSLLELLQPDYHFYYNAHSDILTLQGSGVNQLLSEEECLRAGLLFDAVRPEDAEQVANHVTWPCSPDYVRSILSCGLPSVAARQAVDGQLIGWALTQPYLAIGMVNIMPAFQKQGLGCVVVSLLAREQLERGWTPLCYVSEKNVASQRLFSRLGFQKVGIAHWAGCRAKPNQT